jgi:hypothetical protein
LGDAFAFAGFASFALAFVEAGLVEVGLVARGFDGREGIEFSGVGCEEDGAAIGGALCGCGSFRRSGARATGS